MAKETVFTISEEAKKKIASGEAEYTAGGVRDKKTKKKIELAKPTEVPKKEETYQSYSSESNSNNYNSYDDYYANEDNTTDDYDNNNNEYEHVNIGELSKDIVDLVDVLVVATAKITLFCIENDIPNKIKEKVTAFKKKRASKASHVEVIPRNSPYSLSSQKGFKELASRIEMLSRIDIEKISKDEQRTVLSFIQALTNMYDKFNEELFCINDDIGFQSKVNSLTSHKYIKGINKALEANYFNGLSREESLFWAERYGFKKYSNVCFEHIKQKDLKEGLSFKTPSKIKQIKNK